MASSTRLWKGKDKAIEEDFQDLNPKITYRHLFSQNLGVKDPLRVIALCDSDAFYAGCEMVRLGVDKDTPLVVLQWDLLIAVNYPARKYGISRLKKPNLKELKEKYPDLVVVHVATYKEGEKEPGYWDNVDTKTHKVSLDYYRRESAKIAAKFRECLPGCELEKASIDEAFFDFTKCVRGLILERYPHLAQVPPEAPNGVDSALPPPPPMRWNGLGQVIQIDPEPNDVVQEGGVPQDATQVTTQDATMTTWHDVALSIAAEQMGKARDVVHKELGYSTSAGIARNKFLAKLAASYKKPNNQSILRNAAIPTYLRPIPFQKIRFLGGKLGTALAKEFEAATVGDLLAINLDDMQHKFGEESIWIYEVLRGIDRSEVKEKSATNKSMLASKNLPKAITNASEGFHWIRVLSAELALRLNEARQRSLHLWPKSIVLRTRQGYEAARSKQASFPFTNDVTVDFIAAAGNKLWKELVGTEVAMKVTSVSLSFTGVEEAETGQRSIEGFLKRRREHGDDDVLELFESLDATCPDEGQLTSGLNPKLLSFTCARCCTTIFGPPPATSTIEQDMQLATLRLEHDDFHFAQDLAKEPEVNDAISLSLKESPKKKRHKGSKPEGIERFFYRKS